jgi:hypothetical protein
MFDKLLTQPCDRVTVSKSEWWWKTGRKWRPAPLCRATFDHEKFRCYLKYIWMLVKVLLMVILFFYLFSFFFINRGVLVHSKIVMSFNQQTTWSGLCFSNIVCYYYFLEAEELGRENIYLCRWQLVVAVALQVVVELENNVWIITIFCRIHW